MNMRAPGMTLLKMPLFTWTWLITAYLLIAVMPVFAGAVTMLAHRPFFGTTFFAAAGRRATRVLYQHIFCFFGHPRVYIMILPAFGIVSEIIPDLLRASRCSATTRWCTPRRDVAFLSFIVWAHHMFTWGMAARARCFFMLEHHSCIRAGPA